MFSTVLFYTIYIFGKAKEIQYQSKVFFQNYNKKITPIKVTLSKEELLHLRRRRRGYFADNYDQN